MDDVRWKPALAWLPAALPGVRAAVVRYWWHRPTGLWMTMAEHGILYHTMDTLKGFRW